MRLTTEGETQKKSKSSWLVEDSGPSLTCILISVLHFFVVHNPLLSKQMKSGLYF